MKIIALVVLSDKNCHFVKIFKIKKPLYIERFSILLIFSSYLKSASETPSLILISDIFTSRSKPRFWTIM